jgi:hypothetical protein
MDVTAAVDRQFGQLWTKELLDENVIGREEFGGRSRAILRGRHGSAAMRC